MSLSLRPKNAGDPINFGSKNGLKKQSLGDGSYVNALLQLSPNERSSVVRIGKHRRRLARKISCVIKGMMRKMQEMGFCRAWWSSKGSQNRQSEKGSNYYVISKISNAG
jgi:hypothetical protein